MIVPTQKTDIPSDANKIPITNGVQVNDDNTIEQRLTNIIASKTKLEASDIHPELNLEDSGLDSFARIELILVIEEEFSIELSDSESANVATIADLTNLINEKTAAS